MKLFAGAALLCAACGGSAGPAPCANPGGDGGYLEQPFEKLSQYCLVQLKDGAIQPGAGVVHYDLNTPLFSDYAVKTRTVWMPPGKAAAYQASEPLDFPVGTIFTKSFGIRDDLRKPAPRIDQVETRLLIRSAAGWAGYAYIWNDARTDALLDYGGKVALKSWIDETGAPVTINYLVPSFAQCKQCHEMSGEMKLLGPRARNLNRPSPDGAENQIARLSRLGWLTGAPAPQDVPRLPVWNDPGTGTVEERARAYLEVNCAHCHSETGAARTSGLYLWASETDPTKLGVCKPPVAAGEGSGGRPYDVKPGDPDGSIVAYRMEATSPGAAMPQIGRAAVDKEGLALVRAWIAGLTGTCN